MSNFMRMFLIKWHAFWYFYYSRKHSEAEYQLMVETDWIKKQQARVKSVYYRTKSQQHLNFTF